MEKLAAGEFNMWKEESYSCLARHVPYIFPPSNIPKKKENIEAKQFPTVKAFSSKLAPFC
jgi:hypothetical protein